MRRTGRGSVWFRAGLDGCIDRDAPEVDEHQMHFLDVSADIMEHVDPVFYGDPKTAAMKVLGNL